MIDKQVLAEAHAAVDRLRRWTRGGETAPHKPLLLLYAISKVRLGHPRLMRFVEIETPLRALLDTYGPRRSRSHPEYPFWRLQHDGLWEVIDAGSFPSRASNSDPPISALRRGNARGGLPTELHHALRGSDDEALLLATHVWDRFLSSDPGSCNRLTDRYLAQELTRA